MPGKQYLIMWLFFIFHRRVNFSYLEKSSYETIYSSKMPHNQGTLGVGKKIYVRLSIKPKVQNGEMIWTVFIILAWSPWKAEWMWKTMQVISFALYIENLCTSDFSWYVYLLSISCHNYGGSLMKMAAIIYAYCCTMGKGQWGERAIWRQNWPRWGPFVGVSGCLEDSRQSRKRVRKSPKGQKET